MKRATIVFDNTSTRSDLIPDWGFACIVETERATILFDTGADSNILLSNMVRLGFSPNDVDIVFISHNHFDHIGGLSGFLMENPGVTVYLPQSLRGVRRARKVVSVGPRPMELMEGIYTTGELAGIEQSLVVNTERGLFIFVGCSHPDMGDILFSASQFGNLFAIIGGFHGFSDFALFKGLSLICPTHCTVHRQEIKSLFRDRVIDGGVGVTINID